MIPLPASHVNAGCFIPKAWDGTGTAEASTDAAVAVDIQAVDFLYLLYQLSNRILRSLKVVFQVLDSIRGRRIAGGRPASASGRRAIVAVNVPACSGLGPP